MAPIPPKSNSLEKIVYVKDDFFNSENRHVEVEPIGQPIIITDDHDTTLFLWDYFNLSYKAPQGANAYSIGKPETDQLMQYEYNFYPVQYYKIVKNM